MTLIPEQKDDAKQGNGEKKLFEMVLMPILLGVIFVSKMAMAGIPNIEPVSLLIIAFTIVFGWRALIPVYIYVGLEILIWGPGLWNLMYFYIWLILVALTMAFLLLKPIVKVLKRIMVQYGDGQI